MQGLRFSLWGRAITLVSSCRMAVEWAPVLLRFHARGHGHDWRVFTHMTRLERLLLYRIGLEQRPGSRFLEVGSYLGASACFLASAAEEIGGGAFLHCVDTWKNDGMTEGARDTWLEFRINIRRHTRVIQAHVGRSVDVAPAVTESLDLLFIDGDHSYEGCHADLKTWLPRMRPGGIVILHDYGWAEGVQRAAAELLHPRQCGEGSTLDSIYWARVQ